jgi:hypothetical protein
MKCVICKQGYTWPGKAIVNLVREPLTLVVTDAPTQVCQNCSEEFVEEATTGPLLQVAEEVAQADAQVDLRQYITG